MLCSSRWILARKLNIPYNEHRHAHARTKHTFRLILYTWTYAGLCTQTKIQTHACTYTHTKRNLTHRQRQTFMHTYARTSIIQQRCTRAWIRIFIISLFTHFHTYLKLSACMYACACTFTQENFCCYVFFFLIIFPWLGIVFFNFILVRCVYITSLKTQALLILLQQQCLPIPVLLQEGKDNTVGSHTSFRFALEKKCVPEI